MGERGNEQPLEAMEIFREFEALIAKKTEVFLEEQKVTRSDPILPCPAVAL